MPISTNTTTMTDSAVVICATDCAFPKSCVARSVTMLLATIAEPNVNATNAPRRDAQRRRTDPHAISQVTV